MINTAVEYIAIIINSISIGVVVYGTVFISIAFVHNELCRTKGKYTMEKLRELRVDLGGYILLSLELLIASDILKTILEPGLTELGILGGIVVLRTVLSVFLNKEISEIEAEHQSLKAHLEKLRNDSSANT
ncbi:MAG: DUF1622 domain-containing protein [Treponema sp.]|nr:DUF1622 domain-containing protein [Treponema sp.]